MKEWNEYLSHYDQNLVNRIGDDDSVEYYIRRRVLETAVTKAEQQLLEVAEHYYTNVRVTELKELLTPIMEGHKKAEDLGLTQEQIDALQLEQSSLYQPIHEARALLRQARSKVCDLATDQDAAATEEAYVTGKREGLKAGLRQVLPLMMTMVDDDFASRYLVQIQGEPEQRRPYTHDEKVEFLERIAATLLEAGFETIANEVMDHSKKITA